MGLKLMGLKLKRRLRIREAERKFEENKWVNEQQWKSAVSFPPFRVSPSAISHEKKDKNAEKSTLSDYKIEKTIFPIR